MPLVNSEILKRTFFWNYHEQKVVYFVINKTMLKINMMEMKL